MAKSIFDPDHDIKRIIRTLSAHTGVDIVPKDTLIIIDEIQESVAALGCLKYFKEDFPEYDVAVAGSLLGISIHEDQSFPLDVGLLGAMTDVPASQMLVGDNIFKEFKGAFTECYVNEQLAHIQIPSFYYSTNDSEVEIDFTVQTEKRVIPIEVKAGWRTFRYMPSRDISVTRVSLYRTRESRNLQNRE